MPQADRFVHSMKDRKLDLFAMMDAADRFVGTHDLQFFHNRGNGEDEPTVRTLWRSQWQDRGAELQFVTEGEGTSR